MRTVTEHDIAQIHSGKCREYLSFKPVFYKSREHSRVVDMGMGQKYIIDIRCRNGQTGILIQIRSLLHAIIDQDILSCCLKEMTASRHLMGRSDKRQFHSLTSLFSFFYSSIVSHCLPLFYLLFVKDHAFF